jgi:hypothetical protein
MNCWEFENIAADLARLSILDASLRERGLNHAEGCARCAARLANERSLTGGLKVLSIDDESRSASSEVETALIAAFRRQRLSQAGSTGRLALGSRRRLWSLAAAAIVLITIGFMVIRSLRATPAEQDLSIENPPPIASPTPPAGGQKPASKAYRPAHGRGEAVKSTPRMMDKKSRKTPSNESLASQSVPFLIRDGMTLYAGDAEVATDFLPLMYSLNPAPMESGQLIRVEMPRTALLKFGLPMNVDRANVPVKADLLVGEDGLAQAIRFIR